MNLNPGWRRSGFIYLVVLALGAGLHPVSAAVRLAALFSDNMVLQRGRPVPVWGWGDEGEKVRVEFRGQTVETAVVGGRWEVRLPAMEAGGPDALRVVAKETVEVKNVLVGEVWICSGQSNMEWSLNRSHESQNAIARSANPKLRLLTVPKLKAEKPVDDVQAKWVECGPETVPSFSAVAYFFGRDLQAALNVPVGLIHTSWGGSPAEVWMRKEVLEANSDYRRSILESYDRGLRDYEERLKKHQAAESEAKAAGKTFAAKPPQRPGWRPTELYNGMIAPLIPYAIAGAIWYQGESNASRAREYRTLFPDMIGNWRMDWGQGDFPFLFVQLAPWDKNRKRTIEAIAAAPGESDWAELREAQLHTTKALPRTGMAVITDVGDKDDIHPTRKEPVGARLALIARELYGESIDSSGPRYESFTVEGNKVLLRFRRVREGMESRGGPLQGFAIAGADKKFVWAKAEIVGRDTVAVSSPEVPRPVAVRYGWADYPVVNLFDKDGLPASPFRTDEYPAPAR